MSKVKEQKYYRVTVTDIKTGDVAYETAMVSPGEAADVSRAFEKLLSEKEDKTLFQQVQSHICEIHVNQITWEEMGVFMKRNRKLAEKRIAEREGK